MNIELIPVIEIEFNHQEVKAPDEYPYWDFPGVWNRYRETRLIQEGFTTPMTPYLPGGPFYRLTAISDENLARLVIDHAGEMKEQSCSLFGGYVLRVDEQDKLFPQCCGVLADIQFWENISNGKSSYYEGHPVPLVSFKGEYVLFDLSTNEFYESFQPTPPTSLFQVHRHDLLKAVEKTVEELKFFAKRLDQINTTLGLNIRNIDKVLIWEEDNYPAKK